jgi:hypothetical protein
MSKVPTAEEFVKYFRKQNPPAKFQTIESWMGKFCIEYAKLHVKAVLEAAESEAPMYCSENIKNCYPENLIV